MRRSRRADLETTVSIEPVRHVFLFRRDLRVRDNIGFSRCVTDAYNAYDAAVTALTTAPDGGLGAVQKARIVPVFIYNPRQTDGRLNPYHSECSQRFLESCVADLESQLRDLARDPSLSSAISLEGLARLRTTKKDCANPTDSSAIARSVPEEVAEAEARALLRHLAQDDGCVPFRTSAKNTTVLYFNRDVTPFARARDARLEEILLSRPPIMPIMPPLGHQNNTTRISAVRSEFEDYTLFRMNDPATKTIAAQTPYTVFSFLYRKRADLHGAVPPQHHPLPAPIPRLTTNLCRENLSPSSPRSTALNILDDVRAGAYATYGSTRDELALDVVGASTTRLSRFLKFGCVSVREVYWAVYESYGIDHGLIRELYFREFYYAIAWFHPRVLNGMLRDDYRNEAFLRCADERVPWNSPARSEKIARDWEAWTRGETGTPLVDAGMRQLNATGFMHNRVRMVAAMYLCKNLLIDWREGERFFATRLLDYDPVQNSAGWQWSASVGSDAAPYFRVFNPYTQQARFDPDAVYVRRWVPELADVLRDDPAKIRLLPRWEDARIRAKIRAGNVRSHRYPDPIVPSHARAAEHAKRIFSEAFRRPTPETPNIVLI